LHGLRKDLQHPVSRRRIESRSRHRPSRSGPRPRRTGAAQAAAQQAPDAADVNFVLGQTLLASGRIPEGHLAMATALRLARANHPDYQISLINQLEHPRVIPELRSRRTSALCPVAVGNGRGFEDGHRLGILLERVERDFRARAKCEPCFTRVSVSLEEWSD
jgi:hypothetical protein